MDSTFKSGFVSIIGRTNVGKSTLINAITGEKVAIATPKTQTTRTAIKAIINRENSQIIFIDTPGIHKAKTKLNKAMIDIAYKTSKDVDVILFIVETNKYDFEILDKIKDSKKPIILIINKVDLIKKEELLEVIAKYNEQCEFAGIIPISAMKSEGIEEVIVEIENLLKPGPKYYEEDEYTDQTVRQLIEETLREKALKFLQEEVPHGIFVEIDKMKLRKTRMGEDIYDIDANIYAEKMSHKSIIIGKNGNMIKKIGEYTRLDAEKLLGTKVNLKIWVKVKEDWQNDENIIRRLL